jgi:DNA-binding NtrC family response regulator
MADERKTSGVETLLLVEDEEMVSETAKLSLSAHGYQILCARDGMEALEIFHDRRKDIDLIISDVVMPRMGGSDLLDRIREFDSRIPFILASGYTDHLQIVEQVAEKGAFFIHKPYTPISLVHMVREVLDISANEEP